jgi:hypothetical protein
LLQTDKRARSHFAATKCWRMIMANRFSFFCKSTGTTRRLPAARLCMRPRSVSKFGSMGIDRLSCVFVGLTSAA